MKISRVDEMRQMDRTAIEQYGIEELLLMENAGGAAFRVLARHVDVRKGRGLVVCGGGNNGGDGFVVARLIHAAGGGVHVLVLGKPEAYGHAAGVNLNALEKLGIPLDFGFDPDFAERRVSGADYIVDGLLGTGISRAVSGDYARVIEGINRAGKPVLSLDIPSGVQGDTGAIMELSVQASWTVTFGLPKPGNLLFPGAARGGELFVTHISFPPQLYTDDRLQLAVNDPPALPPRDPDGHKSSFGQALFVAGAASYYGAPHFSAMAFLRAGGGYARLATPAQLAPHLAVGGREIVFLPQRSTDEGAIGMVNLPGLLETAAKMDFVVVGPGMSLADEAQEVARRLIAEVNVPLLIDGDGLTALVDHLALLQQRTAPTILTPHLGEMARLTGQSVADIGRDRIGALQAACKTWQAIVVLKGAHTQIGLPDGRVYVNLSGNSGMGSAGSGDVLTGTIAAMYCLGLAPGDAARMGVFLHGVAGDLAAAELGEDGMTAQDILNALPHAVRRARANEIWARYAVPVVD